VLGRLTPRPQEGESCFSNRGREEKRAAYPCSSCVARKEKKGTCFSKCKKLDHHYIVGETLEDQRAEIGYGKVPGIFVREKKGGKNRAPRKRRMWSATLAQEKSPLLPDVSREKQMGSAACKAKKKKPRGTGGKEKKQLGDECAANLESGSAITETD